MTDTERYESAMRENHMLREGIEDYKKAHEILIQRIRELNDENSELKNRIAKFNEGLKAIEESWSEK